MFISFFLFYVPPSCHVLVPSRLIREKAASQNIRIVRVMFGQFVGDLQAYV